MANESSSTSSSSSFAFPCLERSLDLEPPALMRSLDSDFSTCDSQYMTASLDQELVYRSLATASAHVESSAFSHPHDFLPIPPRSDKLELQEISALLESVVQSTPVPELPCMFDNTYFLSSASPARILESVAVALQSNSEVDFTPVPPKHKIKGTYCPNRSGQVINFRVYIFRKDSEYLVEFQRRCGCNMAFRQFFNHTIASLSNDIVSSSTAQPTAVSMPELWCTDRSAEPLSQLFAMANSDFCDVALQGLRPLASLSKLEPVKAELAQHPATVVGVACKGLQGNDKEVAHCVALTLANLCARPEMRNAFHAPSAGVLLDSMFELLASKQQMLQTQREIAAALKTVGQSHPALLQKDTYISALRMASCSSDAAIRASASHMLSLVNC